MDAQERFCGMRFDVSKAGGFEGSKIAANEFFNSTKVLLLIPRNKSNRISSGFGPAGAADAMNVVFGEGRDIEIDNVGDVCDMDSSSGDISSNHNAVFSALEAIHCPFPLVLVST